MALDQKVVVGGDSFGKSFDRLFKTHYYFNVRFAQVLAPFYEYVAAYMYGVLHPSKVRPAEPWRSMTILLLRTLLIYFVRELIISIIVPAPWIYAWVHFTFEVP